MTGTRFNPCGNYSDTSNLRFLMIKGSLGPSFEVSISTEYQNQESFYPYVLEISVLIELSLGHLCCLLTDVPPQPTSPTNNVFNLNLKTNFMIRDLYKSSLKEVNFYSKFYNKYKISTSKTPNKVLTNSYLCTFH